MTVVIRHADRHGHQGNQVEEEGRREGHCRADDWVGLREADHQVEESQKVDVSVDHQEGGRLEGGHNRQTEESTQVEEVGRREGHCRADHVEDLQEEVGRRRAVGLKAGREGGCRSADRAVGRKWTAVLLTADRVVGGLKRKVCIPRAVS
jgi:hypothetical protein